MTSKTDEYLQVQYTSLRDEILKKQENATTLVNITIVAFGGILVAGIQAKSITIILLYPILTLFLSLAWVNEVFWIILIGYFIRTRVEKNIKEADARWENFLVDYTRRNILIHEYIFNYATKGIFISTELVSLFIAFFIKSGSFSSLELWLLTFSCICTILTTAVLLTIIKPNISMNLIMKKNRI